MKSEPQSKIETEFESAVEAVLDKALPGSSELDLARRDELSNFLRKRIPEYAAAFQKTNAETLALFEEKRGYWAVNYYQNSTFPLLEDVQVFQTIKHFHSRFSSGLFQCPSCKAESGDPQTCTAEDCDWKAFGLLGTLGQGISVLVIESGPKPIEIFKPMELVREESVEIEGGES